MSCAGRSPRRTSALHGARRRRRGARRPAPAHRRSSCGAPASRSTTSRAARAARRARRSRRVVDVGELLALPGGRRGGPSRRSSAAGCASAPSRRRRSSAATGVRLAQAVGNLLANALEHGAGTSSSRRARLRPAACAIEVSDDGPRPARRRSPTLARARPRRPAGVARPRPRDRLRRSRGRHGGRLVSRAERGRRAAGARAARVARRDVRRDLGAPAGGRRAVTRRRRAAVLIGLSLMLGALAASDVSGPRGRAAARDRADRAGARRAARGLAAGARLDAAPTSPSAACPSPLRARRARTARRGEVAGLRAAVAIPAGADLDPALVDDGRRPRRRPGPGAARRRARRAARRGRLGRGILAAGARVDVLVTREGARRRGRARRRSRSRTSRSLAARAGARGRLGPTRGPRGSRSTCA